MATPGLWLLLSAVQTIVVPRDRLAEPVRVPCPVDQTTRIVFPEPLCRFRTLQGEDLGLGVTVESTKPRGVIVVHASTHPSRRTVEFRGPGLVLTLALESVTSGGASEVRVVVADAPAPPSPSPPSASVPAPDPPTPGPPPPTSAPASGGSDPVDPGGTPPAGFFTPTDLLRVSTVRIQRREGLPGQNAMVLVDALQ